MERLLRLPSVWRLTLMFFIALAFQSCSEQKIKESTDETLNITEYLRANTDYSLFLEILDITNYASFMNTYGTYTVFLPTNEAVKEYMSDMGVNSLSEIPLEDLKNLAKLHILEQKVATTEFTDGKIPTPSMYGQYLITGAANNNDVSSITVNKTANITLSNVELGNGVVHVIDKVLRVANKTLAQKIAADPNLSLFTELLKVTGWYDKLNKPLTYDENKVASFLTVLAESNEVYNNTTWKKPNGQTITLNTLDNLKLRYSHLGDPTKEADSLNLYVQYHIVPGLNYLADFATTPVFVTKAPLEVISSKLVGQKILINEDVFNGILEKGVGMIRVQSDETCTNGVLHYIDGNYSLKKRNPSPVYFDLCDQVEFANNVANYRKTGGASFSLSNGALSELTWEGTGTMTWQTNGGAVNGDLLNIFRFRNSSNGNNNIVMKTPVIIKGKYKVWVSYRYSPDNKASGNTKVYFDDVLTSRVLNAKERPNDPASTTTGVTDRVLESQGFKRYVFPHVQNNYVYSRLVGIVEVTTTGRHVLKFTTDACSGCSGSGADQWDMVEFRPIDMDQIWPKFRPGFRTAPGTASGNDLNGDYFISREEANKGDNGNSGY